LISLISNPDSLKSKYKEHFIVSHLKKWIPVAVKDIACFYRDSINFIYTFSGDKYMVDFATLEEVEELLDPKQFYRSNRQSIININAIQSVKPQENQKLTISLRPPLKLEVDISREKAPTFNKWLDR
jgi:DNA-binding LytR/AlgR family response regulator